MWEYTPKIIIISYFLMRWLVLLVSARSAGGDELCEESFCWPRVWILGASKAATTSVAMTLQRKSVCFASVAGVNAGKASWMGKETHVWHRIADGELDRNNLSAMMSELYPAERSSECANGFLEATPTNLMVTKSLGPLLLETIPEDKQQYLRFVAVLREPIARDRSSYGHQRRRGYGWVPRCPAYRLSYDEYAWCEIDSFRRVREEDDSREVRNGLWAGLYAPQLEAWIHARSRLLVLSFEDLVYNDAVLNLFDFLDLAIDHSHLDLFHRNAAAANNNKDRQWINCETVRALEAIFLPANEWLYHMLDRDQKTFLSPPQEPPFLRFTSPQCRENRNSTNTSEEEKGSWKRITVGKTHKTKHKLKKRRRVARAKARAVARHA